jgi:acetoacetyl-CoA synthetase
MTAPELLWTPSAERIQRATLTRYTDWLGATAGLEFTDYGALWRWSVSDLEGFWESIAKFSGVRFEQPATGVLGSSEMPGAQWFPGARLSYAEHIFRGKADDQIAVQFASELRELDEWSWGTLRAQTAAIADGLRRLGVQAGDRVAAYMPNIPETVAAFLAA